MSIEKKSLISTLKTTKKANVVKDDITGSAATVTSGQKITPRKALTRKALTRKALTRKALTRKALTRKTL